MHVRQGKERNIFCAQPLHIHMWLRTWRICWLSAFVLNGGIHLGVFSCMKDGLDSSQYERCFQWYNTLDERLVGSTVYTMRDVGLFVHVYFMSFTWQKIFFNHCLLWLLDDGQYMMLNNISMITMQHHTGLEVLLTSNIFIFQINFLHKDFGEVTTNLISTWELHRKTMYAFSSLDWERYWQHGRDINYWRLFYSSNIVRREARLIANLERSFWHKWLTDQSFNESCQGLLQSTSVFSCFVVSFIYPSLDNISQRSHLCITLKHTLTHTSSGGKPPF